MKKKHEKKVVKEIEKNKAIYYYWGQNCKSIQNKYDEYNFIRGETDKDKDKE